MRQRRLAIELTEREAFELRAFAAEACRKGFGSKAARARVARVCEEKILRAILLPEVKTTA